MQLSCFHLKSPLNVLGKVFLIGFIATLLCVYVRQYTSHQSIIALVNVNAIINRYIHSMAKSKLDETTLQTNTAIFMKKLEEELQRLAQEKKIGLLVSEAILVGGVDYTAEIETRTYEEYQKAIDKKETNQSEVKK